MLWTPDCWYLLTTPCGCGEKMTSLLIPFMNNPHQGCCVLTAACPAYPNKEGKSLTTPPGGWCCERLLSPWCEETEIHVQNAKALSLKAPTLNREVEESQVTPDPKVGRYLIFGNGVKSRPGV